jgi:ribonuclease HI
MTRKAADVILRPACEEDVPTLVKLIHELALYERAPENCHATDEAMHAQLFGPQPRAEAWVAELDGKIAGYAIFFHNFSTWEAAPGLYLEDVYVRPTYRRLGIGRMLLTTLAALARRRGCRRFEWAVLDWNKPARDFYEQLGARPMSEWVIYRTEGEPLDRLAVEGEKHLSGESEPVPHESAEETLPAARPGERYIVHTDGGARPNPGTGGWAAVVRLGERTLTLSGGERETTNNRMELTAAIRVLEALPGEKQNVEMHTDSEYLKKGITSWMKGWKRNGWVTAAKEPVKNVDLWQRLDELCARHSVTWHWLRGHAGHRDNETCDELCAREIERLTAAARR